MRAARRCWRAKPPDANSCFALYPAASKVGAFRSASATLSALKPIPTRLFLHQGGDGVEQTDGSRETRMGLPLSFIGRLEPTPPIDEHTDQGARRNLSKSDARKTLQPE